MMSEQPVLDGQTFLNQFGLYYFSNKSAKPKIGGKNRATSKCSLSWYGKISLLRQKKLVHFYIAVRTTNT